MNEAEMRLLKLWLNLIQGAIESIANGDMEAAKESLARSRKCLELFENPYIKKGNYVLGGLKNGKV